ncbi:creatininase family protein [Conexibacter sp. JD483]|uniref:creatininase family protein n=1 Tax=unclassified Conexibacter TaxID=2627773 RepID=UPI00271CF69B|nr:MULTISPECIES: creatininase family protein [unclassified Conexibacter]MDO8185192.1 creatininase family protein [Conexibacter sp. CPCC 205706]MDO8198238.1 creatininase family protein [Conexibacter sp. CPCC 205762]MDR9367800.1 creatininase family protein [Conexibacter sp. JD483]
MSRWELLTSAGLGAVDRAVPVLLPLAAVEQHGPHLPLATDRLIADHVAGSLDALLGEELLVLPTVAIGVSAHHSAFPGTLTVGHDAFGAYVEQLADSVLEQGFRSLVLLVAHGGNTAIANVVLERLGARWPDRRLVVTAWWQAAGPELLALTSAGPGGVGHACELETALLLHAAPELVRRELIPARESAPAFGWDDADMLRGGRARLQRSFEQIAASGVMGEPRAATAELGAAASAAIRDALAAVLGDLRAA